MELVVETVATCTHMSCVFDFGYVNVPVCLRKGLEAVRDWKHAGVGKSIHFHCYAGGNYIYH